MERDVSTHLEMRVFLADLFTECLLSHSVKPSLFLVTYIYPVHEQLHGENDWSTNHRVNVNFLHALEWSSYFHHYVMCP